MPKTDPSDPANVKAVNKSGAKMAVDLSAIKLVSVNEDVDVKSFKKLKATDAFFIKIQFFQDGVQNAKEDMERSNTTNTSQITSMPSSAEEEEQTTEA